MKYFRIPNLQKHQQYTDRSPPWIKFHADVLDDYRFAELPDSCKAHLIHLWLLASRQQDELLPLNESWLRKRMNAKTRINLKLLERLGFIQVVDDVVCDKGEPSATKMKSSRKQPVPRARARSVSASASVSVSPPTGALGRTREAVIELPLSKKDTTAGITQEQIDGWAADYPGVDVPQELRKMKNWLIQNPRRRKTAGGVGRFIVAWLGRAQDSPRPTGANSNGTRWDQNTEAGREAERRLREQGELE